MDQRALEHYLRQSEYTAVQAATLSHILAEQATKGDGRVLGAELRGEMADLRSEIRGEMAELRGEMGELRGEMGELRGEMAELRGEMRALRSEVQGDISSIRSEMTALIEGLESRLTWRLVAAAAFLGTVMTLVGAFIG